jgi:hypothetical protein
MDEAEKVQESRKSPETTESILYSLATHVLSLPISLIDANTARVVMAGEGEDWRIQHGVDDYNERGGRLLIAPNNTRENTSKPLTLEILQESFGLKLRDPESVIVGIHAEHTREQAEWFYQHHRKYSFESATIYASPYHVVRAYLTVLKYFLNRLKPFELTENSALPLNLG